MKKSIIKRRKRVVPALQGSQVPGFENSSNLGESPEPEHSPPGTVIKDQRGTMNPDGSINLGFRPRTEVHRLLEISTAPRYDSQQQASALDSASQASNQPNQQRDPSLIPNENTLPPMTSYPSPKPRPPSLSPNFLSPNRKRSFSATDEDSAPSLAPESNTKRLSSIKSILNPTQQSDGDNESIDPSLRQTRSPETSYSSVPSLSSLANNTAGTKEATVGQVNARETTKEIERAKMERREKLRREAEKIREALRAKEKELEELNE
jgi:GATA-binding protein, other eukaryote